MKTIQRNGSTIRTNLPANYFRKLKEAIRERQEWGAEPKLQLAQAAYFANLPIHLFHTRQTKYEEDYRDGWVALDSQILKTIRNSSDYMNFLVENKLMERHHKNYSNANGKGYCYAYRLPDPYRSQVLKMHEIKANTKFVKARQKRKDERKKKADESTFHLTKWLDPKKFHLDYDLAINYIREEYKGESLIHKKNKRIIALESLKAKDWAYSREGKDHRLHSLLTRLPKDLKKFIKYSDLAPLRSFDIKSSQPFIFTSLIQIIHFNSTSCHSSHLPEYLNNADILTNMFDIIDNRIDHGALQSFIYEVLSGKFYENYSQVLYKEGLLMKKTDESYYFYGTTERGLELFNYETLREAGKDLVMRTFFSHHENNHNYIKVFKKTYPEAFAVMQRIKKLKTDEKNFFPVLLQNIEADFMLDFATKRIADEYPEIPLFTIHDSISTTEDNSAVIEHEFRRHLFDYFGLTPQISRESWCKDCERAA